KNPAWRSGGRSVHSVRGSLRGGGSGLLGEDHHGAGIFPRLFWKSQRLVCLAQGGLEYLQLFGGHQAPAGAVLLLGPVLLGREELLRLGRKRLDDQSGLGSPGRDGGGRYVQVPILFRRIGG